MAAPTFRQLRAGFAARLDTIDGLRVHDTLPGQFAPPAAVVGIPSRVEQETFTRGTDRYEVDIWVVVARQADSASEKLVEQFMDPTGLKSVRAAIYADTTLGGVLPGGGLFELTAEPTDFVFGSGDREVRYIGAQFRWTFLAAGKD